MASGKAHCFNVLKYKILAVLIRTRRSLTSKEIAELIDVDVNNVRTELSHWRTRGIKYVRRLPKKSKYGAYRYTINRSGIEAYIDYKNRLKHGLSLNRLRKYPKKASVYMLVSHHGKSNGVTMDDVDWSLEAFEERLAAV